MFNLFLLAALAAISDSAIAANVDPGIDAMSHLKTVAMEVHTKFIGPAIITAAVAAQLQLILTNYKEILDQKFDSALVITKLAGAFVMTALSIQLIMSGDIFATTFLKYMQFSEWATGATISPGGLLDSCASLITLVNDAIDRVAGDSILDVAAKLIAFAYQIIFSFIIVACYFIIAISLMMAQAEFWMMYTCLPLVLAMLPLSAFRDQGMAPIKGVISVGIRIIVLSALLLVMNKIGQSFATAVRTNPDMFAEAGIFQPLTLGYLFGMMLPVVLSLQASKLAAAITSGSASFSGADAVRAGATGAAIAGAAIGAGAMAGKQAMGALGSAANAAGSALGGSGIGKMARDTLSAFGPGPGAGGTELGVSPTSKDPWPPEPPPSATGTRKRGALSRLGDAGSAATEHAVSDNHSVGITLHARAE